MALKSLEGIVVNEIIKERNLHLIRDNILHNFDKAPMTQDRRQDRKKFLAIDQPKS